MHYDPIKNIFARFIDKFPSTRVLFYKTLDLMFLRSWYVRDELLKIRKEFGDKEISIYDAGTGFGQYTHFMATHLQPCKIYAVDVKSDWIENCKKFFGSTNLKNVSFGVEDLTEINHSDKFDLIICIDVMEHIVEDVKVFENFSKALKKDGFVVINSPSIYGGSDVHDDHEESFIGEHARNGYSSEELIEKMTPSGLEKYRSKYTYGTWGDIAWRLGIKYPIKMLNLSKILFIFLPVYFLITLPFTLLFMQFDFMSNNKVGSGINFVARKK